MIDVDIDSPIDMTNNVDVSQTDFILSNENQMPGGGIKVINLQKDMNQIFQQLENKRVQNRHFRQMG